MNPIAYKCWYTISLLSLAAALITFSLSQFMELQVGNSKLVFSIVIVTMAVAFTTFVHKTEFFRSKMILTNNHCFRWILKAFVEFFILAFVTMLIVSMKYPRFRIPDDKHEYRTISAIRAYCQHPNFLDPQIKDICSNLPKEKNSEHGDRMGFFSAAAFSLHIFSTSLLLNLPEEYGLFYMCLQLTMNDAVELPGIGGSILNWYYVGLTSLYCFGLIIVRCYYHSSDEVRRRGRNGGDHDDDDGIDGDNRDGRPRQAVRDQQAGDCVLDMGNQQGDGDDGAEVEGGERNTGDQGHGMDPDSASSGWEILSSKEGEEHNAERDDGTSSDDEIKRTSSTKRKQAAPALDVSSDQRKFQNGPPKLVCRLNQEGDSHDGAKGGGRGRKTGDQGHSAGRGRDIVYAKEADELKANGIPSTANGTSSEYENEIVYAEEADELKANGIHSKANGKSSEYENEKISSTSNVIHERIITRTMQAVPSDKEKLPAIKADSLSDKKSAATRFNFFAKSLKYLSSGKED